MRRLVHCSSLIYCHPASRPGTRDWPQPSLQSAKLCKARQPQTLFTGEVSIGFYLLWLQQIKTALGLPSSIVIGQYDALMAFTQNSTGTGRTVYNTEVRTGGKLLPPLAD